MTLDRNQLNNRQKRATQITPSLSADLEFAMINGETALPSKARFYPNKFIYVRGLRYKEQLEISQVCRNVEDLETAYYSVLRVYKNCIIIDGVEFEDILGEDFVTLSLWVVFLTNAEQIYQLTFKCKKCGGENVVDLNPSQMDLYDFECFETQNVETELGIIQIAPTTMRELMWGRMLDEGDNIAKTLILGKHIKKLNGQPLNTLQERLDLYGSLSPKEVDLVREIALKFRSGVKPIECQCKQCNAQGRIQPTLDLLKGLP